MHNVGHHAVVFGIRLLEALFVFGIVGSLIVIILATIEDARTLVGKEDREEEE